MKKMMILLGSMMILILPLVGFAATEPKFPDTKIIWYGGAAGDIQSEVEGTLSEISERAMTEAGISGRLVKYRSKEGLVYTAYPEYGRSRCRTVRGKIWQDEELLDTKIKQVCKTIPYDPSFR